MLLFYSILASPKGLSLENKYYNEFLFCLEERNCIGCMEMYYNIIIDLNTMLLQKMTNIEPNELYNDHDKMTLGQQYWPCQFEQMNECMRCIKMR